MSEQDGKQASAIQRPLSNDPEAWNAYWEAQGQEWRTEPEIDEERQKYLDERRSITPDIEQGIYPFKGIEPKLTRADIEWLLATHENGRGPVDWSNESQREREGLDLRGADLQFVNLSGLPLACLRGSLDWERRFDATEEEHLMAVVQMKGADLNSTHLEKANLFLAHLEDAIFREAHLEDANLVRAQLQGANFRNAHLKNANLRRVQLDEANLENVSLSDETYIGPRLADIQWSRVNLTVVKWSQINILGDEYIALQKEREGKIKDRPTRLDEYEVAVRANRQLAIALQEQGLNEDTLRLSYHAQMLQRKVFWYQRKLGRWFFSLFLAIVSGYGYRIWRILAAYIVVVSLFALAYFVLGMYYLPHLNLDQAYLESITAFHGRVFVELFNTHTPQIWLTALEAIAGLIIEGVFIALLIQRFFVR